VNATEVHDTLVSCLYTNEEIDACLAEGLDVPKDAIVVDGIMRAFGFHPARLEAARPQVKAWIKEMDPAFLTSGGGGMSFLNLCMLADGTHWAEHPTCEAFVVLAFGLKLGSFPMPREMWKVLPGQMPYVTLVDAE